MRLLAVLFLLAGCAGPRQLTRNGTHAEAYFSHDGKHLVLMGLRAGDAADQIYTLDLSTNELERVSTGDGNSPTGSSIKRFVDARISIDPDDVNRVGDNHTITVLVEANTGSGWAAVDVDTAVTVNLFGDADSVVDTCLNGTGDAGDALQAVAVGVSPPGPQPNSLIST